MKCPKCNCTDSKVQDSRFAGDTRRRRRECIKCKHRFTTTEIYGIHKDSGMPLFRPEIKTRDGTLVQFQDQKLIQSIKRSCQRRSISSKLLGDMIMGLLEQVKSHDQSYIAVDALVDWVIAEISQLDKIAAQRYASQHKDFTGFDDLQQYSADTFK